jgi:hypothetical protein
LKNIAALNARMATRTINETTRGTAGSFGVAVG